GFLQGFLLRRMALLLRTGRHAQGPSPDEPRTQHVDRTGGRTARGFTADDLLPDPRGAAADDPDSMPFPTNPAVVDFRAASRDAPGEDSAAARPRAASGVRRRRGGQSPRRWRLR